MMRFEHPEYLWFLLGAVLIGICFLLAILGNRRSVRRMGERNLVEQLFRGYSRRFVRLRFLLVLAAFLLLGLGAANIQLGTRMEKITSKGVDIIVALDVSKSMLAQDVQPSRLDRAKQLVSKLLDRLPGNRIGLVVFAGNAYLQMPLTVDYSAARMYLNIVSPDMVPTPGTVIGKAITMSNQAFNTQERKHKAIILITDGEDHDPSAVDEAEKAYDDGVIINTVGIGSAQGAPIRDPATGSFMRDQSGNIVMSKLNEPELKEIAAAGHGIYQHLDNTDQVVRSLASKINEMQKREFGEHMYADFNSYFQYFLGLALFLLIVEWLIPERKKPGKAYGQPNK